MLRSNEQVHYRVVQAQSHPTTQLNSRSQYATARRMNGAHRR